MALADLLCSIKKKKNVFVYLAVLGLGRPSKHVVKRLPQGNIQLKYFLGGVAVGGGGERKQEAEHVRDASEDHNQFYAAKD